MPVSHPVVGGEADGYQGPRLDPSVGIVGTGQQAQLAITWVAELLPSARFTLLGRDPVRAQELARQLNATAAQSMKVMLADGQIQLVERDDPRFGAFMLSMGCLGIVLEVSFRTVPNVIMRCRKLTVDQEWLMANHERLNQEHLFVKTWWFAWTGEAHVWLVDPASEFEARAYRAAGCLPLDLGAGPAALAA